MVCLIILFTDAYRPSLERLIKQKMKSKGWSAYSVIECGDLCKLTHVHLLYAYTSLHFSRKKQRQVNMHLQILVVCVR